MEKFLPTIKDFAIKQLHITQKLLHKNNGQTKDKLFPENCNRTQL